MAKKLFTTFKAAVDSFPQGEQNVGLLKPGRYSGFDNIITRGALDISITHSGLVKKTGKDNNYAPNFGALMFGTGSILHDDDHVELTIASNSGNVNPRTDYIIAENTYQEVQGGTPIIYSVIQGPSNGDEPTLPNPQKQVLIGKVIITANGYLFTNLIYEPAKTPLPGDLTYAALTTIINQVVNIPVADTTKKGISERATQLEVNDGTDDERHVTSKGLHNKKATQTTEGIVRMATDAEVRDGEAENLAISAKQFRGKGNKVTLTSNYVLTSNDNGKIFVGNGSTQIVITVPTGLGVNFHAGFIWGSSSIKLVAGSGVTLKVVAGRLMEIKDQSTPMLLEADTSENSYFVMGNLKSQ